MGTYFTRPGMSAGKVFFIKSSDWSNKGFTFLAHFPTSLEVTRNAAGSVEK